ncbi:MAG: GTP-binding protein [Clostridium sp.]|nr:GTP-binding protein [Clostridium sp.]
MTKIDIISGFLGAGKTTFIQKLLDEALREEQVVLIENEFGEIGIDSGFLKESGIEIREMNQGCICCSLVGDFETSLKEVVDTYHPDRIIIEPSGVGKLSDIIGAVKTVSEGMDVELHAAVTVVDAKKAKMYARNFGEFFNNQIEYAGAVVLSRTDIADEKKVEEAVAIVREHNPNATVITTPMAELTGPQLLDIISRPDNMEEEMLREVMERVKEHEHEHDHDHDEDDEDEECCCHHHHHDDEDEEEEHHHHHHHDDEDEEEEHHHHHHDHEEHEEDGVRVHNHHQHHHHHHGEDHDADEIFTSWGLETPHAFDRAKLEEILKKMSETEEFGMVVRCKGMLATGEAGKWMYFDMVPEQYEIRDGAPEYTGKVVVIGADLKEDALKEAFVG